MTEREKMLLHSKYGHNKILFLIHLVGRYIKELYRPNIATRKPLILGNGNVVSFVPKGVQIEIYGDNNKVEIDPSVTKWDGHIGLGDAETPFYNCHISIGKNSYSNGVNIIVMEDNTSVGDNVWVAMDCTVLKNSFIAKNCVEGASAVVAGKFTEENCVIAGNPAKVVKRGVAWDRRRPKEYITQYPME